MSADEVPSYDEPALPDGEFESKCLRCFKCGSACPNQCIKFHGLSDGLSQAFTPYITARERGCTLCGECGKVCPSGALQPFEDGKEAWVAAVDMGTARVNEGQCYSFNGRTCALCYTQALDSHGLVNLTGLKDFYGVDVFTDQVCCTK